MKRQYGLIGFPLTHSFSKRFFAEKFENEKIDSTYNNFEIDSIDKLPEIIKKNHEVVGLNVTIPYKEQVIPFLNELNDSAQQIGAINTIKIKRTDSEIYLKGFNTDTFGFETSLKPLIQPYHTKALILGTGGASKAVKYVLNSLNIEYLSVSTKAPSTERIRYEDIDKNTMQERLLIINTTPLGTYPKTDTFPLIPYKYITSRHLLFDLVYNPEVTQFMAKGKEQGATVKNGYEMLVQQALKSYEIWNSEE